jgi:hypothetical protein
MLLAVSAALSALTVWVVMQPEAGVVWSDWYLYVFPLLAVMAAYRLLRPRVPLVFDDGGVEVATGLPLLGLRTRIDWTDIARVRVTARDVLMIELRDPDAWSQPRPWLVRANVRANRRKFNAAVAVPANALRQPREGLVPALQRISPVPVVGVPGA